MVRDAACQRYIAASQLSELLHNPSRSRGRRELLLSRGVDKRLENLG